MTNNANKNEDLVTGNEIHQSIYWKRLEIAENAEAIAHCLKVGDIIGYKQHFELSFIKHKELMDMLDWKFVRIE